MTILTTLLDNIVLLNEGQTIEFKESISKLDKEIVAFANSAGGTIYCGISDKGEIVGVNASNASLSQIQDIARNCDPPINLTLKILDKKVIEIKIPESSEKPHQCSSGFYLRIGANSQKLKTTEVKNILSRNQNIFDSRVNELASFSKDFDQQRYELYCKLSNINLKRNYLDILESLGAVRNTTRKKMSKNELSFTNTGVLLFTKNPKNFIPESFLTAVRYRGYDKFSIIDRQDFSGNLIEQIEEGLSFAKKNIEVEYEITGSGARGERHRYPLVAVREALVNAMVHRDYSFNNSCVYINIFLDRLEIENPGGIFGNASITEIEGKSIRRNPVLSDLLFRAGYGEKLGSGLARIKESLKENNNPSYQISSTNFFSIRLLPRIIIKKEYNLSERQIEIISILNSSLSVLSSSDIGVRLGLSSTTITREIKKLIELNLVSVIGQGRGLRYGSMD